MALLLGLDGCRRPRSPQQDTNVVARVNGEVIARAAFEQDLDRELASLQIGGQPPELEAFKQQLLTTSIERLLLLQAAKVALVSVSAEEVERAMSRISADYPGEHLTNALAQGQMTLADLRQRTKTTLTIEKLFREQVFARVAVSEAELRAYYESHRDELREPEQVHAAQIVVKDLEDARRVQQQLRAGKRFADLARKYSLSPDANVGGDLGFFPRGVMPPQFDEVAFKLGLNQVSDVIATDYGFHLFKVLEKRPARSAELSEIRGRVQDLLLQRKKEQAQLDYVQSLRRNAKIQINEQALSAVVIKPRSPGTQSAEP